MYRFGDTTPFPLRENFIDTIGAVIDAAVALYQADSLADEAHRRGREVRKQAADELRRLDALSGLLQGTLGPLCPTGPATRESDLATLRVVELGREVVARSRETVVRLRDEAMQVAARSSHHQRCREALEVLFASHGLPGGEWSVEWSARDREPRLVVSQQATKALAVEMRGDLAEGDRFERPLRIAELCPSVSHVAVADAGERRRSSDKLGGLAVLELDLSPQGLRMMLGKADKRTPTVVVVRRDGGQPVASWLTADGELGARVLLDATAEAALGALADAAEACRDELVGRRTTLSAVSLHAQPIEELEQPSILAEELLASIAPLVREMRLRSRVPGELVLKRDLGGDRREELFVPRSALAARYAELPDEQRRAFEAIGLGDEATLEFRARIGQPAAGGAAGAGSAPATASDRGERPRARSPRSGRVYGEIAGG